MNTKMIHAKIQWRSENNGGRKKQLDIGIRYFPTIILNDDTTNTPWSVLFVTTPVQDDGWSRINFCLLVENDFTFGIQNKLIPGTCFHFCEGSHIVADGVVLPIEKCGD